MLKFCPECGSKLLGGKFCSNCGVDLSKYGEGKVATEEKSTGATLDDALGNLMNLASEKQAEEDKRLNESKFEIKDGVLVEYKGVYDDVDVIIPDSVTKIAGEAFGFHHLRSIEIPASVEQFEIENIWNFRHLEKIKISEANKNYKCVGNCVIAIREKKLVLGFDNSLIPKDGSVTIINDRAFMGCENLININIPNSIEIIGNECFEGCKKLSSLSIPDSVEVIGYNAFKNCTSLNQVIIGNGVVSIGSGAFNQCDSLTNITIPDNVKEVGEYAFLGCRLSEAIIPTIAIKAIKYCCNTLKKVVITSGASIEDCAFDSCAVLESITIPPCVNFIGESFYECRSLKEIHISDIGAWCKIDMRTSPLIFDSANLYLNGTQITHLIIPDGITEIRSGTFHNCKSLKYVKLPDSVKIIGDSAFSSCKLLLSVEMSKNIISIGSYAFYACNSLKNIRIPYNVRYIGPNAFVGGGSKEIVFENQEGWVLSIDKKEVEGKSWLYGISSDFYEGGRELPAYRLKNAKDAGDLLTDTNSDFEWNRR